MTDRWNLLQDIFDESYSLSPKERRHLLEERCGKDGALRIEVERLLSAYDEERKIEPAGASEEKSERFGNWRAVRLLGRGGMGEVWLAERADGQHQQRAALKLLGTWVTDRGLVQRFRRERQMLALLEHPNIARLLDGGLGEHGDPYLVMEYVDGARLDEYCASRGMHIRERLELFRKICAAVAFAHRHLIIHRDLKPSNILMSGDGEPKLLDFGIAKVLSAGDGSPGEALTVTGFLLTPRYASPEQIQGLPCTIASDVYSLGVILYELLAGQGPYPAHARTAAEIISAIVTAEVPRPSLIAAPGLKSDLRGDLDGIVLKALARKPEDRYSSVERISEDLQRYLAGLPVSAVEGTRWYLARKFVRRHRTGVLAAALLSISLIAGFVGTIWQARVAQYERAAAEQRFSDARKLANFLLFPLYDSIQSLPGSLPVRAEMAAQSLQYLDRLAAARSGDQALRLELAEGYLRLGTILEAPVGSGDSLGDSGKALEADRKAIALLEPLSGEKGSGAKVQRDLAQADQMLGNVLNLRGKPDEGIAQLNRAIAIFHGLNASNPHDPESLLGEGRALVALGDAASGRGGGYISKASVGGVMPDADAAIARFQSVLSISPGESRALLGLAQACNLKGNLVLAGNNFAQGIPVYRLGLDALRRLPPAARQSPESQALEARLLTAIGFGEEETGLFAQAIATLEPARVILDRAAVADPKNATNALRRVNLYRTRAFAYQYYGRTKEAIQSYGQTIRILDGMIEVDPARASFRLVRAELQGKLGQMLARDHRTAEAEQVSRAGLTFFGDTAERPDAAPQNLIEAASAFINAPIPALNDYRRALRYAERASELARSKDSGAFFIIAQCYEQLGDGPKALDAIRHDLALLPQTPPGEAPARNRLFAEEHLRRIELLIKTGKLPEDNP